MQAQWVNSPDAHWLLKKARNPLSAPLKYVTIAWIVLPRTQKSKCRFWDGSKSHEVARLVQMPTDCLLTKARKPLTAPLKKVTTAWVVLSRTQKSKCWFWVNTSYNSWSAWQLVLLCQFVCGYSRPVLMKTLTPLSPKVLTQSRLNSVHMCCFSVGVSDYDGSMVYHTNLKY